MPLYEYECASCKLIFELLKSFGCADEGICCPRCNRSARRKLSVFASFSKDSGGQTSRVAGNGSGCSSCSSSNCSTCGS